MTPAALAALACPSCRRRSDAHGEATTDDAIGRGRLACTGCGLQIPVIDGFALFTEPQMSAEQVSPAALRDLASRLFGEPADYDAYRTAKYDRGLWEAYAAFHPFNESTRAAEPLLATLAAHLKPGDLILDAWGRTGWTGEWLAGLFPDHQVISVWEGDSSVLGYRGFRHWLGQGRRAPNLDIVFVPPNRPLPFADDSFGVVYGLDCLHRYDLYPFAGECLRVARPDAALLFAHIHLTNAEPDPFFERGCRQIHGDDYRAWLDQVLTADQRRGWVLSEAALFDAGPGDDLNDDPDMDHYNGAVLIADPARAVMVAPPASEPGPPCRFLLNPLFRLRLAQGLARIDDDHLMGEVKHLLDRHPIYRSRLPATPMTLSEMDWLIVCLALTGHTRSQIDAMTGRRAMGGLIAAEVLLPVAVSRQAFDLQRFHANQLPPGDPEGRLQRLLQDLHHQRTAAIDLPDGSSLTGEDLAGAVEATMSLLDQEGFAPGDDLALAAVDGPLDFIILLAGLATGLCVALPVLGAPTAGPRLVADEAFSDRLAALIDSAQPSPAVRTGGSLSLMVDGQAVRLDAGWLIEVAGSLRHGGGSDRSMAAGFGRLNTLLFCLMRLFAHEPVAFAGRA